MKLHLSGSSGCSANECLMNEWTDECIAFTCLLIASTCFWHFFWMSLRLLKPSPSSNYTKFRWKACCVVLIPWTVACQAPLSRGILQARILLWVAIPSSREASQPRDWSQVSCIAGGLFSVWASKETQENWGGKLILSPEDLPNPGIEPGSPALQADSLPAELPGKPDGRHQAVNSLSM